MAQVNLCAQDGKLYQHASSFSHHKQVHSKETFTCDICYKILGAKKGLNSHKTKHVSNLNGFQCELCNNSYRCKSDLKRHFRTVHEEKKFTCALCSKTFLRKDILKMHYVKCKNKKEQKKEAEQKTLSKEFEELIKIPNDTIEHEFEDFVAQSAQKVSPDLIIYCLC